MPATSSGTSWLTPKIFRASLGSPLPPYLTLHTVANSWFLVNSLRVSSRQHLSVPVATRVRKIKLQLLMNEISPLGEFLKKSEVACLFQVTERTIDNWVRDGSLPAFHIGRTVRFDREAILKKIREQQDQ